MNRTDWDAYYSGLYKTAAYSRMITSGKLVKLLKRFIPETVSGIKIAELGGANSCFYEVINKSFSPQEYLIVDNNQPGLKKTLERSGNSVNISVKNEDVIDPDFIEGKYDIVFSVGLIEHFSREDTRKCIATHFDYLKSNGICIVTFPTPTWLYKITRKCAELLGIWIFYDERPLTINEVTDQINKYGNICHKSITWSIFLTQGVIVARKFRGENSPL
jgi:phospholipid N-methyltransferase